MLFRRATTLAARSALARTRPMVMATAIRAVVAAQPTLQVRGLRTLDFGGSKENIVERSDYVCLLFWRTCLLMKEDTDNTEKNIYILSLNPSIVKCSRTIRCACWGTELKDVVKP